MEQLHLQSCKQVGNTLFKVLFFFLTSKIDAVTCQPGLFVLTVFSHSKLQGFNIYKFQFFSIGDQVHERKLFGMEQSQFRHKFGSISICIAMNLIRSSV